MKSDRIISASRDRASAFWIPVVLFGLVWTFAPLLFLPNYWLDIIEQIFVGKEWVLSTGKHPALTASILYVFRSALFDAPFAPFLLSQLMMGTVLWIVWRLGRLFLDPPAAIAAVFVSLNYYWMNFGSADYNNNITLIFGWALSFYFGLNALRTNRWRDWIGLGAAIGLGLHLKYTEIFFPVSLVLFLAFSRERRSFLLSPRFWLATAIGFLIFLPQTLWILHGHLRTIQYAVTLEGEKNPALFHLICPLAFSFCQLTFWVIPLIFLSPLFAGTGSRKSFHPRGTRLSLEENYLLTMTFLPFLMQVLFAAISARFVRLSLGCHLWIFVPIILLRFLPHLSETGAIRRTKILNVIAAVLILLVSVAVTLIFPRVTGRCSRFLFPGKELARQVEQQWHSRYAEPIPWATGEWWPAGNVAIYGSDHPRVHYSRGPDTFCGPWQATTWGTYKDIRREGGVLLWEIRPGEPDEPKRLREIFPDAQRCPDIPLHGLLTADVIPLRFGMAVLPPRETDGFTKPSPADETP